MLFTVHLPKCFNVSNAYFRPYDTMQAENHGYQPSPGDNEPAVYADSYFAYQE